jgi:hypothetical protein
VDASYTQPGTVVLVDFWLFIRIKRLTVLGVTESSQKFFKSRKASTSLQILPRTMCRKHASTGKKLGPLKNCPVPR